MWDYIGHLCHKLFICFPYRDPVELETSSINVHYSFNYRIQPWTWLRNPEKLKGLKNITGMIFNITIESKLSSDNCIT